jgi:hypothetical protein
MRIDEETAGMILGQLDDDPPTPSRIDLARAVTDARRRRRNRRVGGYTAVAGATALLLVGTSAAAGRWLSPAPSPPGSGGTGPSAAAVLGAAPPAPTKCALGELPLPDGRKMALVTGADPTGRFLLGRTYPATSPASGGMGLHVVIWDRRTPRIVALPGDDQSLSDVNSRGVAIGTGWAQGGTTSYFYRDGKVAKLPGGDGADVRAINDAGAIVGTRNQQPVIWRSGDQSPVVLPLPSGATGGAAVDIDEDGTVIGVVGNDLKNQRPYMWSPGGGGHDLAIPSGVPAPTTKSRKNPSGAKAAGPTASVFHIRLGWVSGRVNDTAVQWNLRTGETRTFPEFGAAADNINRYGWQIGINTDGRAQFRSEAGPLALPELAPHPPGGLSNIPTTLSDDGKTIGGQSDDRDSVIHAVVWTCT